MEPSGRFFIQRKTLLWSTFKKIFLCEKRCPFFVPGYRYADKGQGGKKHEKETLWENAASIRGSLYAYDGVRNKGKQ